MKRQDIAIFALFVSALALPACSGGEQFVNGCTDNTDCPTGATCRIARGDSTGVCICRSDEACEEGEICNSQGVCQARSACRSNVECPAEKFCDLASGACIDRVKCGTDVHCLPGTVCDDAQGQCVSGCYDSGDCPLGAVCQAQNGSLLGACITGICESKEYCEYGQFCTNSACTESGNAEFCADCDQFNPCADPSSFCLINSAYDPSRPENGTPNFCGVECDQALGGADCPNGYDCGGVVLLTQDQCTQDSECGGGGRECVVGEGDLRGFCTCVSDQDCDINGQPARCVGTCGGLGVQPCTSDAECLTFCEMTNPQCMNTGRPCGTDADCALPCVNGGCVLGAACAPSEGLLCVDVR